MSDSMVMTKKKSKTKQKTLHQLEYNPSREKLAIHKMLKVQVIPCFSLVKAVS